MVLSCLSGALLSKAILRSPVLRAANRGAHPRICHEPGRSIEIVLKVIQNQAPFQNRDSIGNPVRRVSLVPPWCLPGGANGSLPGASRAVPRWLSDGSCPASLVPRKRSNESFLASLVPLRLSKWTFPASLVPHCQRQSCAPSGANRGAHPRISLKTARDHKKIWPVRSIIDILFHVSHRLWVV